MNTGLNKFFISFKNHTKQNLMILGHFEKNQLESKWRK